VASLQPMYTVLEEGYFKNLKQSFYDAITYTAIQITDRQHYHILK